MVSRTVGIDSEEMSMKADGFFLLVFFTPARPVIGGSSLSTIPGRRHHGDS